MTATPSRYSIGYMYSSLWLNFAFFLQTLQDYVSTLLQQKPVIASPTSIFYQDEDHICTAALALCKAEKEWKR